MTLRRDEGLIYTFAPFSGQSVFLQILHLSQHRCHKIRLSYCRRKVLVSICQYSRWRSQLLSDVRRAQRYNTLDFPRKVVCHETAGFFGFFRSKGNSIPSEHLRQRRTPFPFGILLPPGMLLASIVNPDLKKPRLSAPHIRIAITHSI